MIDTVLWWLGVAVAATGSLLCLLGMVLIWERVLFRILKSFRLHRAVVLFILRRNLFAAWMKKTDPDEWDRWMREGDQRPDLTVPENEVDDPYQQ